MGRVAASVACVLLVSAVCTHAADSVRPTTIAVPGRTSLVMPARMAVSAAEARAGTILLTGTTSGPCEPLHLASSDPRSVIAALTLTCTTDHTFEAAIDTRSEVTPSIRRSAGHVYVDLTTEAAVMASSPSNRTRRGSNAAGTTSDLFTRASALAAAGKVRELSTLIQSLPEAQRDDQDVADRLDSLMNTAQRRRLELDRALFAGTTDR